MQRAAQVDQAALGQLICLNGMLSDPNTPGTEKLTATHAQSTAIVQSSDSVRDRVQTQRHSRYWVSNAPRSFHGEGMEQISKPDDGFVRSL